MIKVIKQTHFMFYFSFFFFEVSIYGGKKNSYNENFPVTSIFSSYGC